MGISFNTGILTTDVWTTEQFDFAAGDSNGVRPDDDEEREEEGDLGSADMHSDSNSNSCRVVSKEGGADGEEAPSNVSIRITDDQVTGQLDFALGDSTRVALVEGEEKKEEDSSSDPHSGMDSNSDSTDNEDGGMSDVDMLGNTFQLMDIEAVCMEPLKSMPAGDVDDMMTVPTFGPKHGRVKDAPGVKGKEKTPGPDPLAFSKPLECNFFTPSLLVLDRQQSRPSGGSTPGSQAGCGDTTSQHHQPKAMNDNSTRICELRDLQDSIESNIRANIWQELGKIVESSVATALEKALPDLINQSGDSGAGTSSPQTSKFTPKKIKKLPNPRTLSHNEFKKSVRELGKELLCLGNHTDLPQPVGQREISAWDSKHGPCCMVEDFHIDLKGRQGENLTLEYVSQAWLTHVMALRTWYKDRQQDDLDRKEHKARNWRRQRKYETAYEYKEIKDRAVAIVEPLGQDERILKEQLQVKNQSDTLTIPSQYTKMAEKYNLSDRRVVLGRIWGLVVQIFKREGWTAASPGSVRNWWKEIQPSATCHGCEGAVFRRFTWWELEGGRVWSKAEPWRWHMPHRQLLGVISVIYQVWSPVIVVTA
ncbi:hypothetical protein F5141DRAFT_1062531 [Pisolithus sp. B1]|nr:hypothetical protein F5141DRAFT_1062531 [Pisolithus sp. B1]